MPPAANFWRELSLPRSGLLLMGTAALHALACVLPAIRVPLVQKIAGRGLVGSVALPFYEPSYEDWDALYALFMLVATQYIVALALLVDAFERDAGAPAPLSFALPFAAMAVGCTSVQPLSGGPLVIALAALITYRALSYSTHAAAAATCCGGAHTCDREATTNTGDTNDATNSGSTNSNDNAHAGVHGVTTAPSAWASTNRHATAAGAALALIGAWHSTGLFLFPALAAPLWECIADGWLGCTLRAGVGTAVHSAAYSRVAMVWFVMAGALWLILGTFLLEYVARVGRGVSPAVGACVFSFGLPALVVPNSGFWLFFVLGAYMLYFGRAPFAKAKAH
eukprot:TRINITY_DN10308_c0_g1_i1.p2 TRINITY_DN10308_c0_g1~~TRINITY_DN10308_c0_g1_i1.p2  ORF type:complete len:338 (+),score=70.69 TRINITY_DN10308_c0_g1_i1:300-1313(+)